MIIRKCRFVDIRGYYLILEEFVYNFRYEIQDAIYCVFNIKDIDYRVLRYLIASPKREHPSSTIIPSNAFHARDYQDILEYIKEGEKNAFIDYH